VVLRACPEAVAQKERLVSLGQASLEFVHANNPIPEVASRRCTQMDQSLRPSDESLLKLTIGSIQQAHGRHLWLPMM